MCCCVQEDKNGTLNYEEFMKLLSLVAMWKKMYFKFDTDRSGTLEKREVASAVRSLGEHAHTHTHTYIHTMYIHKCI